MNIEMTDLDMILNHLETTSLEPHDDYTSEFTYKDQKILYKYITELQQENKILKENAELKKQLTQYHLDIDKLYKIDNPFDKLKYKNTKYMLEENKKLKKQLHEASLQIQELYEQDIECPSNCSKLKELKKQLQIKAEGFKAAIEELCECAEENEKLKKELEEANKKLYLCTPEIPQNVHGAYVSYVDLVNEMYELKKRQQEFINWLENGIKRVKNTEFLDERIQRVGLVAYNRALQKYKKIIGKDINVLSKGGNKDE